MQNFAKPVARWFSGSGSIKPPFYRDITELSSVANRLSSDLRGTKSSTLPNHKVGVAWCQKKQKTWKSKLLIDRPSAAEQRPLLSFYGASVCRTLWLKQPQFAEPFDWNFIDSEVLVVIYETWRKHAKTLYSILKYTQNAKRSQHITTWINDTTCFMFFFGHLFCLHPLLVTSLRRHRVTVRTIDALLQLRWHCAVSHAPPACRSRSAFPPGFR